MLLRSGVLSLVLFTFQMSESLASSKEVQTSANDQTLKVGEISKQQVRDDYIHTLGVGYHKFHTEGKPWNQARKICMAEGGHLAIINSQKEFEVLLDIYKVQAKNIKAEYTFWAWLGAHNLYENNDWVTVSGEPISSTGFEKWAPGQPTGDNEHCLCMFGDGEGFNDGGCDASLPFFCEISDACHEVHSISNNTAII